MQDKINSVLKEYFGFNAFRFGQDEIIRSLLNRNDTLAVMPTGGGKSLCYQLPALISDGTAIVISPLIALMKDQVDSLAKKRYPATFINSTLTMSEIKNRIRLISQGEFKLLYLAPERLESRQFLDMLNYIRISFLAVDEAHCISEWGHDFRPSYLAIPSAFAGVERFPIVALTATATPEVQTDILNVLGIPTAQRFIRGFDRPNLTYSCVETKDKTEHIINKIGKSVEGSTIIYAGSRKRVDNFHEELLRKRISVVKYHAGLMDQVRKDTQDSFINSKNSIIIATNAFGMGIDKPNVRNVFHLDYTLTLEAYYQESGRAGRDGIEANCVLLHNTADINLQHFFIKTTHPEKNDIIAVYNKVYDLAQVSLGSSGNNAVYLSDAEIANLCQLPIATITSVLKLFEKEKIIIRGSTSGFGKIMLTRNREELFEIYNSLGTEHQSTLEALLRNLSREAFRNMIEFDLERLVVKNNLEFADFNKSLNYFQSIGIINHIPPMAASGIRIVKERMDNKNIPIDFPAIDRRRDYAYKKFEVVRNYAMTYECKRNFILDYFGDTETSGTCGKCSSCTTPDVRKEDTKRDKFLKQCILDSLQEMNKNFGRKILSDFVRGRNTSKIRDNGLNLAKNYGIGSEFTEDNVMTAIQELIKDGFIVSSTGTYPVLKLTSKGDALVSQTYKTKKTNFLKPLRNFDKDYFQKLKSVRKVIADTNGMSDYQIISDKMLRKIAEVRPSTIDELQNIEGLNIAFVENFGIQFLSTTNSTMQLVQTAGTRISSTQTEIIRLVENGQSFQEITKQLNISSADAAREIQLIIENINIIDLSNLVDPKLILQIGELTREYPSALLKDLRIYFGDKYDLPTLRVAYAIVRKRIKR
jgi:ATP-dependent DNA helicase RecQ